MRLFGQQLAVKRALHASLAVTPELDKYPCLKQWLAVVGLPQSARQVCTEYLIIHTWKRFFVYNFFALAVSRVYIVIISYPTGVNIRIRYNQFTDDNCTSRNSVESAG